MSFALLSRFYLLFLTRRNKSIERATIPTPDNANTYSPGMLILDFNSSMRVGFSVGEEVKIGEVEVGVGVKEVAIGVGDGDGVAVGVGVKVGSEVGVGVKEGVGVCVGADVGVGVGVEIGAGVGDPILFKVTSSMYEPIALPSSIMTLINDGA